MSGISPPPNGPRWPPSQKQCSRSIPTPQPAIGNATLCPRFGKHSSRSQLHLWFHLFRINHICLFVASFLLRFDSSSFISQVSTRHELVSVCWETTGKYMLAVLGPIEGTDSKMVVMKNPTKVCITSTVNTGYKRSFSAVFRPYCHYIMSCSADVGTIGVWRETKSNVWMKFSSK